MTARRKVERTTIVDVAKAAGVSPSTVSHVLNGTASISDATKEKVQKAVEELQYFPNTSAKMLRNQRGNLIGLMVQDMTSSYYSIVYERLMRRAQQDGYMMSIVCGEWDTEQNSRNMRMMIEHRVEGIIVFGQNIAPSELKQARAQGLKIVLCDQYSPDFSSVEWNNFETMRKLVHVFCAEGCRRIAYLHVHDSEDTVGRQVSTGLRLDGYIQGMKDEGLDPQKDRFRLTPEESRFFLWDTKPDRYINYLKSMPKKEWPQVVLCEHDAIAQGITYSLIENGIRVPEDIRIVGFDNTTEARFSRPSLTTVQQKPTELADEVWEMMKAYLDDREYPRHVSLSQTVIVRQSAPIAEGIFEREALPYKYDAQ